jgi:hypothetical protein
MKIIRYGWLLALLLVITGSVPGPVSAWFDETHLAIAKVASYEKWFNAAGPDVAKLKLGDKERAQPLCEQLQGRYYFGPVLSSGSTRWTAKLEGLNIIGIDQCLSMPKSLLQRWRITCGK